MYNMQDMPNYSGERSIITCESIDLNVPIPEFVGKRTLPLALAQLLFFSPWLTVTHLRVSALVVLPYRLIGHIFIPISKITYTHPLPVQQHYCTVPSTLIEP